MANIEESVNSFLESYGDIFNDFNNINNFMEAEETLMFKKVYDEYKSFKTSQNWRSIQDEFKKVKNDPKKLDEQFKLLMKCKAEILRGREYIASIPEDGWANFGYTMAVLTLTVGFTVACLTIPGIAETALGGVAIFTSILAPVYTFIRGYYMAYGGRDTYNSFATIQNQQNVGCLSKQVAVAHMDKMLADVNKKLAYVMAKKALNVNKAAALIADKCSDQFLQQIDNLETNVLRGNKNDIEKLINSRYFDNGKIKNQNGQNNDKKNNQNNNDNNKKKDKK